MRNICVLIALVAGALAYAAPAQRQSTQAGTMYLGAVTGQDWGRPLASGDLDGDGYDEVIVAASESYGDVISRVYVVRGGPGAHGRGTIDLASTAADQVILGAALNDNLGSSIATGDTNGDGIDDLLLCASSASPPSMPGAGMAYVIFGGATFFSSATRDLSVAGTWNIRFYGPATGADMGGSNAFGGLDAHSAAIGRVNNDAYGDIILGAHLADGAATQAGRVFVIYGRPWPSGFTLNLAAGTGYSVRIDGKGQYDELGTVVATGDLTGDGIEELILPCQYASKSLFSTEGAVYIFRGRQTWSSYYSLATTTADITLLGARAWDELGEAAATGDFNGDGVTDLASAAPGADAGAYNDQRGDGFVYGLLGSATYQTGTYTIDYATATPDFVLIGEFEENLGMQVSAGDFNADGIDDIAAAEWFAGPDTNGAVEVLYGRGFSPGASYTANVNTDLHILGASQDRIGFSLAAADVNADGLDEIVFGTPFNNGDAGTVYVFTEASGDTDHDGDVDLLDAARLQGCVTAPAARGLAGLCVLLDFDFDEDIDALDAGAFAIVMAGPGGS